jgi:hypothetical protein
MRVWIIAYVLCKYRAPSAGIRLRGGAGDVDKKSMKRVMSHENIETEATGTADTSEARYFAKDTDVGEHRSLYAPISFPLIECMFFCFRRDLS